MSRLLFLVFVLALPLQAAAQPKLPMGATPAVGTIPAAGGSALTITTSKPPGVIHWQSFQIGAGGAPRIEQPSSSTLNRVSVNPQQIQGALQSSVSLPRPAMLTNGSGVQLVPLPSGVVAATQVVQMPDGRIVFQAVPR